MHRNHGRVFSQKIVDRRSRQEIRPMTSSVASKRRSADGLRATRSAAEAVKLNHGTSVDSKLRGRHHLAHHTEVSAAPEQIAQPRQQLLQLRRHVLVQLSLDLAHGLVLQRLERIVKAARLKHGRHVTQHAKFAR
jgi:hypothetical protein